MPWQITILLVLVGLFLVYWLIIYLAFRYAFVKNAARPVQLNIPTQFHDTLRAGRELLQQTPKQEVSITSADGLRLTAEVVVGRSDRTVILFHGYRSGISDFAGAFSTYLSAGCNVILVHHRAHGLSQGKFITYGIKESQDCVLWAEYAAARFGGSVFLGGISMGASTVLFSSDKSLPSCVKGIAGDCPFSSPYEIIYRVARQSFHVPKAILPVVMSSMNVFCRLLGGFSIKNQSAVQCVKNARVPIVITHGKSDTFVPVEMSRDIISACSSPCALYEVEGADHGLAYLYDTEGCFDAIRSVFKENSPV